MLFPSCIGFSSFPRSRLSGGRTYLIFLLNGRTHEGHTARGRGFRSMKIRVPLCPALHPSHLSAFPPCRRKSRIASKRPLRKWQPASTRRHNPRASSSSSRRKYLKSRRVASDLAAIPVAAVGHDADKAEFLQDRAKHIADAATAQPVGPGLRSGY